MFHIPSWSAFVEMKTKRKCCHIHESKRHLSSVKTPPGIPSKQEVVFDLLFHWCKSARKELWYEFFSHDRNFKNKDLTDDGLEAHAILWYPQLTHGQVGNPQQSTRHHYFGICLCCRWMFPWMTFSVVPGISLYSIWLIVSLSVLLALGDGDGGTRKEKGWIIVIILLLKLISSKKQSMCSSFWSTRALQWIILELYPGNRISLPHGNGFLCWLLLRKWQRNRSYQAMCLWLQ